MIDILANGTLFHLKTKRTSYVLGVFRRQWLVHYYWGGRIDPDPEAMQTVYAPLGNGAVVDEGCDGTFGMNRISFEYPYGLAGDYRNPAFEASVEGRPVLGLKVKGFRTYRGCPVLDGLPHTHAEPADEVETLEIMLLDPTTKFHVRLSYTVFGEQDVIARNVTLMNSGTSAVDIARAFSFSVDLHLAGSPAENSFEALELVSLPGAWARERRMVRNPVLSGRLELDSNRGISSHTMSPHCALVRPDTTEYSGDVWGFALVYSGDWKISCERNEDGRFRIGGGINPDTFAWFLPPGASFDCPEALMSWSEDGLNGMSHNFHGILQEHIVGRKWKNVPRPILVNNWEATYFDFDENKLLEIAEKASELGIELFVLDDGWFGERNDDRSSLGDWHVNTAKLPGGLSGISGKVHAKGLKFGLWIEPEMVSPDSDLYREHPDWCLHLEGRSHAESRNQLVLDLTRADVRDEIVKRISLALGSCVIDYVKWDMNRPLSHTGSAILPGNPLHTRTYHKEIRHRFVLGLYDIMNRITKAFPDILFEGCASGGGRMDYGVLYYMPQYWTSDNTDAVSRIEIQYATSLFFPPVTMGSHVSAVPNHQTNRVTSLETRSLVAMSGNFGYELDLAKFLPEDSKQVCQAVAWYKTNRTLIQFGRFYRLLSPFGQNDAAWMFVSENREKAVFFWFRIRSLVNTAASLVRLSGLDPALRYTVKTSGAPTRILSGSELMKRGVPFISPIGDGEAVCAELEKTRDAGQA